MTYSRRLALICSLGFAAVLTDGCGAHLKAPLITEAMPIKPISGATSKKMASYTGKKKFYFRGSKSLTSFSKAVQMESMILRSLMDDEADRTEDARKDDKLVDLCPEGRPNLDFIIAVDVGVKHSNEEDTQAAVVATYKQTQKGLCGIRLTPTFFDIKEYVEDYIFVVQVTGSLPPKATSISGYYTVQDYEGL